MFIEIIGLIKKYLIIKKIIKVKEIPYYKENEILEKTRDDIIEKYGNFYLIISIIYFL
ncbi:hypothetical protein [Parvimonas sp. M20]|uniref:hypothetical protein n=1 Tax=Parvimonas sp. M20 TaxID=3110693 RepID=UPI002B495E5B|nr:hypothetical protein [Parvimonas sp. M20]MEB3025723.1 hypothetical protein [Parvimonas sp. M13]